MSPNPIFSTYFKDLAAAVHRRNAREDYVKSLRFAQWFGIGGNEWTSVRISGNMILGFSRRISDGADTLCY